MLKNDKISFTADDGSISEVEILEQTMVGGVNYLLVYSEDDDQTYIFKENGSGNGDDLTVEEVTNDEEWDSVYKIFEQLMEDMDFEKE